MVSSGEIQRASLERAELRAALGKFRTSFLSAGFFSLFINLLLLVPTLYMLQVYDRVLVSNSESTLLMLTLITVFLFAVMGALEWVRSKVLIITSTRLDGLLGGRVFDAIFQQCAASGGRISSAQPLNDLLQVRQFLTGPGLFAFFDAPWFPVYLAVMFLFHPWFGAVALVSALVLGGLAVWNEAATRATLEQANRNAIEASQFTQRNLRNVEVIDAMGMRPQLKSRWQAKQSEVLDLQNRASARSSLISMLSKTYRLTIQSVMLGIGAYLAIHRDITPGLVVAGSILMGRALAPLDLMISTWRGFIQAREAFGRLEALLRAVPARETPMPLPAPKGCIVLEKAIVTPPGAMVPVLKGISLAIEPGTQVGIIGPSAAGKSTLARAVLGLVGVSGGSIRLDGAEVGQWDKDALGKSIGYLPQDVELLDGTVGENIARFGSIDPQQIIEAAQAAGVHEMILRLPNGYDTRIVSQSAALSAGQRQRLGLARALYGSPALVVLDEPNSNLDQDGEAALLGTLAALKRKGQTTLVITHRTNVLLGVDKILLLVDGTVALFGPRDQVLAKLQAPAGNPAAQAVPRPASLNSP